MPLEENAYNQCDMDNNTYFPTQFHSLADMDHNHNLTSYTSPPSLHDSSDFKQVTAHTPHHDLAVNSDAFILTPGTPSTVHIINLAYNNLCELWIWVRI